MNEQLKYTTMKKNKKSITVPINPKSKSDIELLQMLEQIKTVTGMQPKTIYRSCLIIGAQMEIEKINQLKTKSNENKN